MSQIAVSNLFLCRDLTAADSATIHQLLRSKCERVRDTRKGRHWEAYNRNGNVGLTIHVYRTEQYLHDCEDDLMGLGMSAELAPECINITTNRGTDEDLKLCDELTQLVAVELGCATTGARLCS